MLASLRISNFAIIEQLEVEFDSGLTVITGETGAGKSIIMGAIRLLLGERATAEVVRSGTARAGIEGVFAKPGAAVAAWLDVQGLAPETDEDRDHVLIRRDVLAEGNSRNFINGRSATVSQLKELGRLLVDMHGQNDHTSLHSPAVQLQVLDSFGDYAKELAAYARAYAAWKAARERYESLTSDVGDAERRRDFLQFQVEEIQQAALRPGEDAELEAERRRLGNAEKLSTIGGDLQQILYEGNDTQAACIAQLSIAVKRLQELAALDPEKAPLVEDAETLRFGVEDLWEKVQDYIEMVAGDPQRLDEVENRLELLRSLKRKYGATLEEVIAAGERLSAELNDIVNHDEALERARTTLLKAVEAADAAARALTAAREKAGRKFEKLVQQTMRELELPKAVLNVQLETTATPMEVEASFSATGQDTCEFMVSLNPGEPLKPMRKVASGGEVSRIMLAIKTVLAHADEIPTLIFDEIDTGISGQAATRVGEKLSQLSGSHQVLCITHLPQVAARGDLHLVVKKDVRGERTSTMMVPVEGEQRTLALAQMLSGESVDETTRKFAERLLVRQ